MFIQTEATPNPSTLKFFPGQPVMTAGTADFPTREDAERSPLASRLFEIDGITGVFFGADFISLTKADDQDGKAKPDTEQAERRYRTALFSHGEPLFGAARSVAQSAYHAG